MKLPAKTAISAATPSVEPDEEELAAAAAAAPPPPALAAAATSAPARPDNTVEVLMKKPLSSL